MTDKRIVAAAALVIALTGGTAGGVLGTTLLSGASTVDAAKTATVAVANTGQLATSGQLTNAEVAAAVSPSVVTVLVTTRDGGATGSGFVIDSDGLIVTNHHVVENAQDVQVRFSGGRTAPASIVGSDATADLAVLRTNGISGLTAVTPGDSASVAVGDAVLAFGSPLGLEGTVTAGIVSAVHRGVDVEQDTTLTDLIQTDAAINPGNSGGPLVDATGRVIGITVAIATTDAGSGNIGVGFAIPMDTAQQVLNRLLS